MMRLIPQSAFLFCAFFVLTGWLHAKDEDSTAPLKTIDVCIYAIAYAEGSETVYLSDSEEELKPVRLSKANVLGPYPAALNADSTITLRSQQITETEAINHFVIAHVQLPDDVKEPLLILSPSEEGLAYDAMVVEISMQRFPLGSYLLANLSPYNIRGHVGAAEVGVSPENVAAILPAIDDAGPYNVQFEYDRKGSWKSFANSRWTKEVDKRTLLVAYMEPRTSKMKIRGLPVRPFALSDD